MADKENLLNDVDAHAESGYGTTDADAEDTRPKKSINGDDKKVVIEIDDMTQSLSNEDVIQIVDPRQLPPDPSQIPDEGHREEISGDALIATFIAYYRAGAAPWSSIPPIIVTQAVQIASLFILVRIKSTAGEWSGNDIQDKKWALFVAQFIFICACIGAFLSESFPCWKLLFEKGVFMQGKIFIPEKKADNAWEKYESLDEPKYFPFKSGKWLCILVVIVDTLVWCTAVMAGGRLVNMSTSLAEIILNALSAVFVLEVDNLIVVLTKYSFFQHPDNTVFIKKDQYWAEPIQAQSENVGETVDKMSCSQMTAMCGQVCGACCLTIPLLPVGLSLLVFYFHYW